ncbi:MAG: hypothetical protein RR348_01640, partial [Clostridia bacterium]
MKKRKLIVAMLFVVMIASLLTLAGCSGAGFDIKGGAKVNITFDKAYNGIEVSCPEGDIVKSDATHFVITFDNRKQKQIAISCAGFVTKYLN